MGKKIDFICRQDFMVIPFQAVEVYLDNVVPAESEWSWKKLIWIVVMNLDQEDFTSEAIEIVKSTVLGACFHATVTGYHYDNTAFIQLTKRYGRVKIDKNRDWNKISL